MEYDLRKANAEQLHEYIRGRDAARAGQDARSQPPGTSGWWMVGWLHGAPQ